jgi:hypothetical protein
MAQGVREEVLKMIVDGSQVTGSYNELKKAQKEIQKNLRGMEEGTAEYIKESQKLNRVNKQLDESGKKIKGVGEEWKKTNSGFGKVMGDMKAGISNQIKSLSLFGVSVGELSGKFGMVTSSVGGSTTAMKLFKTALIATGIGAFVLLLVGLVSELKRTQQGTNIINKVLGSMSTILNVVLDRLGMLANAAVKFVQGDFAGAWNAAKEAVTGVLDEIKEEVKTTKALVDAQHALERQEIKLIELNAKRENQIMKLQKIAKDDTKTAKERLAANEQAAQIEIDRLNDEMALQKERARILEEQGKMSHNKNEDDRAEAEARAKVIELETASIALQIKLQTQRNQLIKELGKDVQEQIPAITALADIARKEVTDLNKVMATTTKQMVANMDKVVAARGAQAEASTAAYRAEIEAQIALAAITGQTIAGAIESSKTFEEAGKNIINTLRNMVMAELGRMIATVVAKSFAANPIAGALIAPIAAATAKAAFNNLVPSFYHGGDTGNRSLGFGDRHGAFTGFVHADEYVIPKMQRNDPKIANLEAYADSMKKFGRQGMNITNQVNASVDISSADQIMQAAAQMMQAAVLLSQGIPAVLHDDIIRKSNDRLNQYNQTRNRGTA